MGLSKLEEEIVDVPGGGTVKTIVIRVSYHVRGFAVKPKRGVVS